MSTLTFLELDAWDTSAEELALHGIEVVQDLSQPDEHDTGAAIAQPALSHAL